MTDTTGNNYPNPLDRFRSYSYHYVMTAASTTEFFRKALGSEGGGLLSAIQSKKPGDEFLVNGQTGYLILDTRRFSQYTISELEMQHVFGTGNPSNPTVPVAELKMRLIDSTGLSFFSFMMDMMRNKLKTSRAGVFFLLSIIFVGHRDDGVTETISTCHIPLILLTMAFTFTHLGSEYDIEFMETYGAPQRGGSLAQINNLGKIRTLRTKKGGTNTIGEMLENLEDQLNTKSLQFYQKYFNDANKEETTGLAKGRLVQYMITVPNMDSNPWHKFKLTGTVKSVTPETQFKKDSGTGQAPSSTPTEQSANTQQAKYEFSAKDQYSILQLAPSMGITDAIKLVLEASQEFRDLASTEKLKNGQAKAFKTITSITCDDTTYAIHFDVIPFYLPKLDEDSSKLKAGDSVKKVVGSSNTVKNVISYDYIYSGYNSHILDLKIQYNPESAVALDTNLDISGSRLADQASKGASAQRVRDGSQTTNKSVDFSPNIRTGDPIFIPLITKDEAVGNVSDHTEEYSKEQARDFLKSKQEYSKTYAALHFMSSITMDMTVRGNPNIIRKYADSIERGGVPPHETIIRSKELVQLLSSNPKDISEAYRTQLKSKVNSSKQYYIDSYIKPRIDAVERSNPTVDPLLNKVDISTLPVFVKINIYAPDVDWTGNLNMLSGQSSKLFTQDFFFNGPYQLILITTKFSGGEFKHDMSLIPYVVNDTDSGKDTNN